jgi:hypothetical protein
MHRRFNCDPPGSSRCTALLGFFVFSLLVAAGLNAFAQDPYQSAGDFERYAMKLREGEILKVQPHILLPPVSRSISQSFSQPLGQPMDHLVSDSVPGRYPWKMDIMTTVFWIGEKPTRNNPVPNTKSAWDANWVISYGGFDDPDPSARHNYIPVNFTPRQNPFYCALPYNDVTRSTTKSEAPMVVPWFKQAYRKYGESVCRNRWIEIYSKNSSRVCYAQWSDCGPFRTDNWQYVFGDESPSWNINRGAGLDVSPAVRDYLGLSGMDVTSWRFVDFSEIPTGPWSYYGDNNDFVINSRANIERVASRSAEDSSMAATVTR